MRRGGMIKQSCTPSEYDKNYVCYVEATERCHMDGRITLLGAHCSPRYVDVSGSYHSRHSERLDDWRGIYEHMLEGDLYGV
jgi:hypothetical protein